MSAPIESHEIPAGGATFTPREVVSELDRYIVGQGDAKRAVAIAPATAGAASKSRQTSATTSSRRTSS